MTDIIIHGCAGQMGRVLAAMAAADPDCNVVAGADRETEEAFAFPFFTNLRDCDIAADVVVDFSVASATDALLDACAEKGLPLVLCTTGLSEEQTQKMHETAKRVAVLKSANMSLGINLLLRLVKEITPVLHDAGFDLEIVEQHHRRKVDAPSGTAIALADAAKEAVRNADLSYVFDRSGVRKKRGEDEIGISAVRGGTIVGEHDLIFAGEDEVITIRHTAYSRAIFAKGALTAAKFLAGKPPGMYSMEDLV